MKMGRIEGIERAGRPAREAIREVWRLLKQGIDMPASWAPALHDEIRELAAPHMAVLVHKRTRMVQALQDERWAGELADFIGRIVWPHLSASGNLGGRDRHCLAELLDEIVAAEQRAAAGAPSIPLTSRFETSWAT
ncbi:MAG TPA: hypothetical protein VMH86_14090 [Rhizomicrobium sp.]|nr:hypothetical protein [Rhizomicrobium sp.]